MRTDIPLADQLVQAAHAALDAGNQFEQPEQSCHMAVLAVKDEEMLMQAVAHAETNGVQMTVFYEPDPAEEGGPPMGYTAAASEPIQGELRKIFKKWGLWKPLLPS